MKTQRKFLTNGTCKIAALVVLVGVLFLPGAMAVNVIMQHNDLSRTGANTSETILTPANVATSFGPLFTNGVDGQVYAQPLYVQNLNISGGAHDVVFVCTESNSVYAFDADTPGVVYWHDQLGAPFSPDCSDLYPYAGITGTPVIDLNSGTLYVDTKLASGSHELHALNISTGAEKFGGPATIAAAGFTSILQHQRPGLLLMNGVVYLGFGSHCDEGAYHGFELGFNATNLSLLYTFNTTPTGSQGQGGIWSCGMAPAVDTNGNIYVMTGNGAFDGTNNFSMSVIKLSPSLVVEDYATPTNWQSLSDADLDFGTGGAILIPPNYVVCIGKETTLFLANINNMGHVGHWAQSFTAEDAQGDLVGPAPVYWQGPATKYLFVEHAYNPTTSFEFTGSSINPTPLGISSYSQGDLVGGISLSADGNTNGILWETGDDNNVRAYDAVNFPAVLWMGGIDSYVKMTCPTIANGKVYEGTTDSLTVFGLTNYLYAQTSPGHLVLNWTYGTLQQSTNVLKGWVNNSATSPYAVAPTNAKMFYRLVMP